MSSTEDVNAHYDITSNITVGTKINLVYEYSGEDEENVDCYYNLISNGTTALQFRLYYGGGSLRFSFDQEVCPSLRSSCRNLSEL